MVTEPKATRKRGKQSTDNAEQTKIAIMTVATKMFADKGFEATSLRDIAEQTGTTHGLIRHHFGSKEGLWQAAVDYVEAKSYAEFDRFFQIAPPETDTVDIAKAILRIIILNAAHFPEMTRFIFNESIVGSPRLDYVLAKTVNSQNLMHTIFDRLQQEGYLLQFNRRTFFLFILTAGILPITLAALSNKLLEDDIGSEEQLEQHINRILILLFGPAVRE